MLLNYLLTYYTIEQARRVKHNIYSIRIVEMIEEHIRQNSLLKIAAVLPHALYLNIYF